MRSIRRGRRPTRVQTAEKSPQEAGDSAEKLAVLVRAVRPAGRPVRQVERVDTYRYRPAGRLDGDGSSLQQVIYQLLREQRRIAKAGHWLVW